MRGEQFLGVKLSGQCFLTKTVKSLQIDSNTQSGTDLDGRVNTCELLISIVIYQTAKIDDTL